MLYYLPLVPSSQKAINFPRSYRRIFGGIFLMEGWRMKYHSKKKLQTFPWPIRRFTVKKTHNGSAVSEILQYTQTSFYFIIMIKLSCLYLITRFISNRIMSFQMSFKTGFIYKTFVTMFTCKFLLTSVQPLVFLNQNIDHAS